MRFTKNHEWVELQGDVASIGVTAYAAEQLGDVVFVTLPAAGQTLKAGGPMAVLQSVQAVMDVLAPIDGEVTQANAALPDTPEMINQDPEKAAWIVRVKVSDSKQVEALMDRPAYEAFLDAL
jgi:glycine cleavage system H protein